jgi:hypothetical protein
MSDIPTRLIAFCQGIRAAFQPLISNVPLVQGSQSSNAPDGHIAVVSTPPFLVDLRRMQKFYGIYSAVARDLGTSPQHVRQVATGLHQSARVMDALECAYQRIQQESESEQ